ncbi:MAG TPA: hypothetical protein VFI31_19770 [Pirellulales bacterium]|nr:hypothetical protein [Pirellulales bacterium]
MRQAADHLLEAALDDPTILLDDLRHREIVRASQRLEGTYVVRLFAEFETGSRQYWEANWPTFPKTVDLLDGLAARCGVPDTLRDDAHLVRDYRNSLVHEREEKTEAVPMATARGYLCRFFSFLPLEW